MITEQGAKKRLAKRLAYKPKPIDLDPNFAVQNDFINDPSKYLVAQCSRRAGKTNALAIRFLKTMEKYPKSQCVYLGLTLESARNILWPVLQDLNDQHQLGCKFVDSKLIMTHPNGAKLRILGADMSNFIKRLKGIKAPGIAIDEAQDFGPHLQSLVDDVLTPCIADYADGWLAMTGTPGPVPQGYFYRSTHERKYGYSFHGWTVLDNPYMPNPAAFIDEQMVRNEWDENNPTLLREWKNQWVLDVQSLWVQYKESINHFIQLPTITPHKWNYVMGIDLGFKDADAIAVLAWSEQVSQAYLVEEVITTKQTITDLVGQIQVLTEKYGISKMVIDEGGLGKKIAEELRRQKSIPVHQADKARKQENVSFLNDALRTGRFKAKGASKFAQDSYLVQIDWDKSRPDKIVIKKHPHSDIIDAVLYAFRECPIFAYEPPKPKPKYGSREWAEAENNRMFELEMEGLRNEEEARIERGGFDYN